MGIYSIRDLEVLSGIKAHTLRIWEQRFGIIEPKRTETNIRYYDDEDLKKILNISLLNQNGYKISKIAEMKEDEISKEVISLTNKNFSHPDQTNTLIHCMVSMDRERFEKVISKCVIQYGFEATMTKIIFPFLNKVGLLWLTGSISPAQEHFISHLIRKKIMVALDGQVLANAPNVKTFLLYLPEGEYHELGLLFGSYIIRSRQHKVIYLGQSLPLAHLKDAYKQVNPDYLFTVFTTAPTEHSVQEYVDKIASDFINSKIIITGYQVVGQELKKPDNVDIIYKIDDLIEYFETMQ
ncbi:MAG TPA: MerR family transcriptional regulator [Cytophagales bacterium]|nr:MerR family transcriptional regulator [Cytophagales bacterium]